MSPVIPIVLSSHTMAAEASPDGVHPDDHPPFPDMNETSLALQATIGWSQLRVRNEAGERIYASAPIFFKWSERLRQRGDIDKANLLYAAAKRISDDPYGDVWGSLYRHFSGPGTAIPPADFQAILQELGVEDIGPPDHAVGPEGEIDPANYEEEDAMIAELTPEFFAQQQAGEPVLTPEQRGALHGRPPIQ